MLSVLILSQKGEGNELADKLVSEGNVVKFWVKDPAERVAIKPSWQEIDRYEEHLATADLCIFTSSGFGGVAKELRERGKMVVGGVLQDVLVKDPGVRDAAIRLMSLAQVIPSSGVEASLCGWYDGKNWITLLSQQYSRLMEGNRGPKLDMGCVVGVEESLVVNLTPILQSTEYRGFVRVEVVIHPDEMYFKSIDCNHSALEVIASCEALRCSLTNLLTSTARGRLRSPEYPQYGLSLKILGFSSSAKFQPPEAAIKHCWKTYGDHVLGYISAGGSTPTEARRRVYRTAANSTNIDTIYRRDVGCSSIFEGDSDAA